MTTYGEASVVTDEHEPHLDLSFVSPEAIDQLRQAQYEQLHNASFNAILDPDRWRDAITPEMGLRSNAQQREAASFDDAAAAYVERHLDAVPPDARDLVRKVAVGWVIRCSAHRMNDEEWYLGKDMPGGQYIPSGWEYLEERVQKLIATYEGIPDDDPNKRAPGTPHHIDLASPDDEPADDETGRDRQHRRLRDLPLLGAIAVMNGGGRLRDRWHRRQEEEDHHRIWPYAAVAAGGLTLAGAGLYLLLDRAGGAHHILSTPHPGRTPPPPSALPPPAPPAGHPISQLPRGTEVFGPVRTGELTRTWAAGTNANHILHFISERRGQVSLRLEGISPDGTVINGHAVDLMRAENLRANITVNVNGNLNTLSVPMQGDSLDLHGNLAKLIQSGKFSSVEVVRQHGNTEAVFSTIPGKGRSISARAFRSYLDQVQQHSAHRQGGGSPPATPYPPAPRKVPPTSAPSEHEAPGDDTGFWHNPIVDGTMIAAGLAIAGGAIAAGVHNQRRTVEEVEETEPPERVGLDILGANGLSLPPEREQEFAEEVQARLQEEDTSWLRPGRTPEEYRHDFTPVAIHAVTALGGDISERDRQQLVDHLVNGYCRGSSDEIYRRLRSLTDSPGTPIVQ